MTPEQEEDRRSILAAYDWCCARCGRPAPRGELMLHHRLMRSQGGSDAWPNRVPLCFRCHDHAHAHPAESYESGLLIRRWQGHPAEPFGNPSTHRLPRPILMMQNAAQDPPAMKESPMAPKPAPIPEDARCIRHGRSDCEDCSILMEACEQTEGQRAALTIPDDPFEGLLGWQEDRAVSEGFELDGGF